MRPSENLVAARATSIVFNSVFASVYRKAINEKLQTRSSSVCDNTSSTFIRKKIVFQVFYWRNRKLFSFFSIRFLRSATIKIYGCCYDNDNITLFKYTYLELPIWLDLQGKQWENVMINYCVLIEIQKLIKINLMVKSRTIVNVYSLRANHVCGRALLTLYEPNEWIFHWFWQDNTISRHCVWRTSRALVAACVGWTFQRATCAINTFVYCVKVSLTCLFSCLLYVFIELCLIARRDSHFVRFFFLLSLATERHYSVSYLILAHYNCNW